MVLYELTHMFFRYREEFVYSPKNLGLYYSIENSKTAIDYYSTQPGFCDNKDAFSVRECQVIGSVVNDNVFEALIYLHSKDYEVEMEIQLGLYGDERIAQNELYKYCTNNTDILNVQGLIAERIINRYVVGRKEWTEGFSVSKADE